MIVRKTVRRFGSSGHVIMPKEFVGHEVALVTDEDMLRLEDMIYEVLALRKLKRIDDSEAMKKIKALESEFRARLDALEERISSIEKKLSG